MASDSISISYPSIYPGAKKTEINFYSGKPDLVKLFFDGDTDGKIDTGAVAGTPGTADVGKKGTPAPQTSQKRYFITDANVASLDCMQDFTAKFEDGVYNDKDYLLVLGSGEKYKTIETLLSIITVAAEAGFTRKDMFVGIGGGVICDITAFAASIYERGIEVQFVPTTLLAMVDATVGGKTSCDYENSKNIMGTFFTASKAYYFPEFVQYLPEVQYNSGLAEAFKTALLFDKDLYETFKNEDKKILARDRPLLEEIIKKCVIAKGKIVEKDFSGENVRAYLSLGHTFGYALESLAGLGNLVYGTTVAWGIGRSVELAYKKEYCLQAFKDEVLEILEKYGWESQAIPPIIQGGGVGERLLAVMHKDKKNFSDKIRLVLQKGVEDTLVEEVDDKDILSVLK